MSTFHDDSVLPPRFSGGLINWRVRLVHWAASCAGLLVHIEGMPYGTNRNARRGNLESSFHGSTLGASS